MEDNQGIERESLLSVLFSSSSAMLSPPDFSSEILSESKALSMATNDCSSILSSPTEASPAKPDRTSTIFDGAATSPSSHIASASENAVSGSLSIITVLESSSSLPVPSAPFGEPDQCEDRPATLTCNGVSVTLDNESVWKQFYSCGTEMVLSKVGRRMFPYCRYRLSGLEPDQLYSLILSIVPYGSERYHWNGKNWKAFDEGKLPPQQSTRAFFHHHSPHRGSVWMSSSVSFYKLKLTNQCLDMDEHIFLQSLRRYIPRLHVVPVSDKDAPFSDNSLVLRPESMTFIFPQTEFITVTTYQNFQITQLKINHNPFAKGFREDGKNPRLYRVNKSEPKPDAQPAVLTPAESKEKEEALDLSTNKARPSETKVLLKPIMSTAACKDELYAVCIKDNHPLAELVPVEKPEQTEADISVTVSPEAPQNNSNPPTWSDTPSMSTTPATSTPTSSLKLYKKRKRVNKRWANPRGKEWYRKAAITTVAQFPLIPNTSQPELDDVEGLLFVSFSSKEALESHIKDNLSPSPVASPSTATESKQTTVEESLETEQEKITRLESILLNDLCAFKHKQAIHPSLQKVGLKLTLLDTTRPIDLQYLGVYLPLPPSDLQDRTTLSSGDDGSPFISRTGKTSDVTKIKGWKNKFSKSKETSPTKNEGLSKNLSAFCCDLLDEYLESEARQISERAESFSTRLEEESVSYQLPVKSSSYVKTLDSALKHRNTASKMPAEAKISSPVSFISSAVMSPPPQSARSPTSFQPETPSRNGSSHIQVLGESPAPNFGLTASKAPLHTRLQLKMYQIESIAKNQGLLETKLTSDRLSVALSVMLTKQTKYGQVVKEAALPEDAVVEPECGEDHCRLGCVCSNLRHPNRRRLHCGRPECMFGCTCFKRKITKQVTIPECEQQVQPVYSMASAEHEVPPRPGCHSDRLWNRSLHCVDPEPNFSPCSSSLCLEETDNNQPHISVPDIPEEDKDPVYKYFESLMTCARVRVMDTSHQSEFIIEPKRDELPPANPTIKTEKTNDPLLQDDLNNILAVQKSETATQEVGPSKNGTKIKIQVQSMCSWAVDRMMVLKALCEQMSKNSLDKRFEIGPYCISPINKILMEKPGGAVITHRVRITKHSKNSYSDEDDECEEDSPDDEQEGNYGVTPFLSGVIAAGKLKAMKKSAGGETKGLVQVNNKCYSQARLLLGNMGSLHPANRLAAYVTGRLSAPNVSEKSSEKHKSNATGSLQNPPEEPVVRPAAATNICTDVKSAQQQQSGSDLGNIRLHSRPQKPQTNSNPVALSSSNHRGFSTILHSGPLSLTVSPSLKSPGFLGEKGTCSFRIRPPSINQGSSQESSPGVSLPGGYTMIKLPVSGANGKAEHLTDINVQAKMENAGEPPKHPQPMSSIKEETSSPIEIIDDDDENVSPGVSEESNNRFDSSSSDSSDEFEEDDELVDIETVEDDQEMAIERMKNKARMEATLLRNDSFNEYKGNVKRKNHTAVERLRRCEQRILFEKLQTILRKDQKTPKLVLLSEAREEIDSLVQTSNIMEKMKKMLSATQSDHMKKLSLLSGRTESQIKNKMLEISRKQKLRMKLEAQRPSVSGQLQSQASPQSEATLLQKSSPSENSMSGRLSELRHHRSPDKPIKTEQQVTEDQNVDSPAQPETTAASFRPPSKLLSFPLIRSKNGRIILPSCMKQLGKNLVSFRLVKLKKGPPADKGESVENLETNASASDQQHNVDLDGISENKSAPATNQSTSVLSMDEKDREQKLATFKGSQSMPVVYLQNSTSSKDVLFSGKKRYFMTKQTRDLLSNKFSTIVKENVEKPKGNAGEKDEITDNPPLVKRGRGRPPKKRPGSLQCPTAIKKAPPKDKKDRSIRFASVTKEPRESRPLTRGSLGKDFPSAKKQSWIDVEKELEEDMDYQVGGV